MTLTRYFTICQLGLLQFLFRSLCIFCSFWLQLLLNFKRWRVDQYQAIIKTLTPDMLAANMPRLLARAFLEGLVVGNISPEEAQGIVDNALDKVGVAMSTSKVLCTC
jgi:secreted Zn-dependent insulinase-like peptidase